MKEDEYQLLLLVAAGLQPRHIRAELGMHPKRLQYLCESKWTRKRWYDYGVTYDLGWLTPEGLAAVEAMHDGQVTKD